MKDKNILKKINRYEYVSFDMFDTLVKRPFKYPSDLFKIIERKSNIIGFYEKRIKAEQTARLNSNCEVTLEDIYDVLKNKFFIENALSLKEMEIELEKKLCIINNDIKDILDYCIINDKKIVIVTDIYLNEKVIEDILKKNNIKYNYLYVSSSVKYTKSSGELFKYVLNDLKIDPNQIIHIGDNLKSDYLNPRKYGINSYKIPTTIDKVKHYKNNNAIDFNTIKYFINNNLRKNDYFYNFGFSIMGPLLFFFCKWLKSEIDKNKIDKILFFSRDGYIIKKAYDVLYPNNNGSYFYTSRRSMIIPSFYYKNSIQEIISSLYFGKNVSVSSIIKSLGLEINENISSLLDKYEINPNEIIDINFEIEKKDTKYYLFFNTLFDDIKENSYKELTALKTYLSDEITSNKIAIVDIGWFGNMQAALETILDKLEYETNIFGYYVGLIPNGKNQNLYNMKGYLFDKNHNVELYELERRYNSVFETMFLADHGSLKKYDLIGNKVEFVFKEYENKNNIDLIKRYQKGAIDFCNMFVKLDLPIKEINIIDIINDFGTNPNLEDALNWGNISFESGTSQNFIAKSQNRFKYLIRPDLFLKDLTTSYWKIGFLKNVFHINMNYNRLYDLLRRIRGEK